MKILMINKFLHPNGGSETYIFRLGEELVRQGHEVEYFGMEHAGRCVGNSANAYTADMDFHGGSKLSKLLYPIKTIYSHEARKKLRAVLEAFEPDVCHLNNFNYQLTPSVILEIRKWERQTGHKVRILYTAHDYQLICPNHMLNNPNTGANCENCIHGSYANCVKGRCIHGSAAKSLIGMCEAVFWKWMRIYRQLDTIICPSRFMKSKLDTDPVLAEKTVALLNFVERVPAKEVEKQDYVLYFGRFSPEKNIGTLLKACQALPHVPFVFAGSGPLEHELATCPNVKNVGFQTGESLELLVRQAAFSLCPSRCYENCPFSVMESILFGTPVLGANIGGIPELIDPGVTGELFESGNAAALTEKIKKLWEDKALTATYSENCKHVAFDTVEQYCHKLLALYRGDTI